MQRFFCVANPAAAVIKRLNARFVLEFNKKINANQQQLPNRSAALDQLGQFDWSVDKKPPLQR